jgi:hypothetical protein
MMRAVVVVSLTFVLLVAAGYASLVEAQSWGQVERFGADNTARVRLMQFGDPDTDLDSCQQDCRSRYGLDMLELHRGRGGDDRGRYYLYARCIEDCNRRFWKRFDKETEDTK